MREKKQAIKENSDKMNEIIRLRVLGGKQAMRQFGDEEDLIEAGKVLQQESDRTRQRIRALEREKENKLAEHIARKAGLQKELEAADNRLKY